MPDMIDEIERKFTVGTIEYKGRQVWPYLRYFLGSKLISGIEEKKISKTMVHSFFRNFTYGLFNLFRKFDYLAFSDSGERKKMGEFHIDKSIDFIAATLARTLVCELPLPAHFKRNEIPTNYISSKFVLFFLETIYLLLHSNKLKIHNEAVITNILADYQVNFDYRSLIRKIEAQVFAMNFFLNRIRPRAVFVECSYTNFGRIRAIKDRGIGVVEIQHGVINRNHLAYNISLPLDKAYFPDYILTFGEQERGVFCSGNFFIAPDRVFPVGHHYLDYLNKNAVADERFRELRGRYRKVIAVTAQDHYIGNSLIAFLEEAAGLEEHNAFIYIPRGADGAGHRFGSSNIVSVDWLNTYEIISLSDFHSTVFSTCAIEAPSLGVQNILIDLEGLSRLNLGALLPDASITQYVNTPEEYVRVIAGFELLDKARIMQSNRENIVPDYEKNMRAALNSILQ